MIGRVKYEVMSDEELNFLKGRMEQLLIERGVHIDHEEMLEKLAARGCIVDMKTRNLKFTKKLIDQAVDAVPKEFTLYSPSDKFNLKFPHPEGSFYTRTCTGAPNYRTWDNQVHYVKPEEVDEWYKITNVLENLDFVTLPSTSGEYFPEESIDVMTLEKALNQSAKHIWIQPYETENVNYLIDEVEAAEGGNAQMREKPWATMITCSVPLLSFKRMDAEAILRSAERGMPVQPCSLPTAGANTPVTAQGTAFMASAEVFAQILMIELINPGLAVIATPLLFSMDMQTTYTLQSNTEITIARLIAMELFERGYNIRAHSYGTGTDSIILDAQNFIERTNLTDAMAMSEASVLGGAGQLETAKTISPIQLIIDNEIFGIAKRIRRGLAVNDETIDWDEIISGIDRDPGFSFLMSEHTMRHFAEPHRPDMFNRDGVTNWQRGGSKDLLDKALEKFQKIQKNDAVWKLDEEASGRVAAVREKACRDLHEVQMKKEAEGR